MKCFAARRVWMVARLFLVRWCRALVTLEVVRAAGRGL